MKKRYKRLNEFNKIKPNIEELINKFEIDYKQDDIYKKDPTFSLLHYAAKKNSKEIGEILISKGADINAKDNIYLNMKILFLINII